LVKRESLIEDVKGFGIIIHIHVSQSPYLFSPQKKDGQILLTGSSISLSKGIFPPWASDVFGADCCGWDGPLDFGLKFELIQFSKAGNKIVMDKVSKCYNDLFEVTINPGTTVDEKLIFGLNRHQLKLPSVSIRI